MANMLDLKVLGPATVPGVYRSVSIASACPGYIFIETPWFVIHGIADTLTIIPWYDRAQRTFILNEVLCQCPAPEPIRFGERSINASIAQKIGTADFPYPVGYFKLVDIPEYDNQIYRRFLRLYATALCLDSTTILPNQVVKGRGKANNLSLFNWPYETFWKTFATRLPVIPFDFTFELKSQDIYVEYKWYYLTLSVKPELYVDYYGANHSLITTILPYDAKDESYKVDEWYYDRVSVLKHNIESAGTISEMLKPSSGSSTNNHYNLSKLI